MKNLVLTFFSIFLLSFVISGQSLNSGDKVPDFTAIDDQGDSWTLSDHLRNDYIIFYFYPAAFTGGCTKQACSYRDEADSFEKINAMVVGISGDEYENLTMFKKHHNLNFTLLSDPDGNIAKIFGVPFNEGSTIEKEIDNQTYQLNRGVTASRWTFVVDSRNTLIYKNKNVDAANDSQSVYKFISTHQSRKSCVKR